MRRWAWIDRRVLIAAHHMQLAEHGGAAGTRDEGLLDSALARAKNLAAYGNPGVAAIAAAYGVGIIQNHPFVDGNKRTALIATELFLVMNGVELIARDVECAATILALAAGELEEVSFADWIRKHALPR